MVQRQWLEEVQLQRELRMKVQLVAGSKPHSTALVRATWNLPYSLEPREREAAPQQTVVPQPPAVYPLGQQATV